MMADKVQKILYLAAGYSRVGGIEVYLLHYATEMRRRGFDVGILVFEPLPKTPHWCLQALLDRGIPIRSLADPCRWQSVLLFVPACLWAWAVRCLRSQPWPGCSAVRLRLRKRLMKKRLKRILDREEPTIVHVKGRLITEAFAVLPPEKTIFHIATSGERDPSWDAESVGHFRSFVERCAAVLAPGRGVADRFSREFAIKRAVTPVFTMAPDAVGQTADSRLQTEDLLVGSAGLNHEGTKALRGGETEDLLVGSAGLNHEGTKALRGGETGERKGLKSKVQCPMSSSDGLMSNVYGLKSTPATLRFGFLGRFAKAKGVEAMLDALALLQARGRVVSFTFFGTGPMEAFIRERIRALGLSRTCVRPIATPEAAVATLDVIVLPSESEAMPLVLVEGLMAGRPCIATAVGGIPDLIRDGQEGFLLKWPEPEAIAAGCERFLNMTPAEFEGFARRARARYEEACTPEVVGEHIEGIYRDVVGRQTLRREG